MSEKPFDQAVITFAPNLFRLGDLAEEYYVLLERRGQDNTVN